MVVQRGVPQGLVLRPLFYTIYMNKLPHVIRNSNCTSPAHRESSVLFPYNCGTCGTVPSYADDATFVVETKTRESSQIKIENAATLIKNFFNSQELSVNLSKTSLLESMVKQKRS